MVERRPGLTALGRALARALDGVTEAGVRLAMAGLAAIVAAYVFEVTARYAFDAPTRWSADLVSYLLLFVTFMAMPEVTRKGGHVAVTVLVERLPPGAQAVIARLLAVAGAALCFGLAKLSADETARQFARDVRMMAAIPAPKGWISVWIAYGFGASGLHFARFALAPRRPEH
jgi:TRAP-type C4-dicarboxylate transport system permease small subunit